MSRKIHIVGNWKMNQTLGDIKNFFTDLQGLKGQDCQTWVAPQFVHLAFAKEYAPSFVKIGAQNCSHELTGAFTGDVSAAALKEMGIDFTIIGHSERRAFFGETHTILNQKTKLALKTGLDVIFCVGETLKEREDGKTESVVQEQLDEGLAGVAPNAKLLIAYEPVWAIGTGKTATPAQAQEVHAFIRQHLSTLGHKGQDVVILYGGSVKPDNVAELLNCPDIDGGLVGGASLKSSDFKALCLNR